MSDEIAAKFLIISGLFIVAMAFGMWFLARFGYRFPGGIHVRRDSVILSFPVVSSITLSVALAVMLNLILSR